MSSKTFKLDLREGTLLIPQEVTEYLHQCQGNIEVLLTIESSATPNYTPSSAAPQSKKELQAKLEQWFDEVEQLESTFSSTELDDYTTALVEKYRQQGLEL